MALNQGMTSEETILWQILQNLKQIQFNTTAATLVDTSGGTTFSGFAVAGSLTSAAVWAISKTVVAGNITTRTWAVSSATANDWLLYNKIWDNRNSLTYS